MAAAAAQVHRIGLCRTLLFHRPTRHPTDPVSGIWESHRRVARHALRRGHSRILVLEDDICFTRFLRQSGLRRIAHALDALPTDWRIFYLGHWPIAARFLRRDLLRTQSACTHAYIANRPLLLWLREHGYDATPVDPRWRRSVGRGLDAAYASQPGAYAIFPMVATQSRSPSDHLRPERRGKIRRLRHVITRSPAREWLLSGLMRPNELLVALRSPWSAVSEDSADGGRRPDAADRPHPPSTRQNMESS